MNPRRHHPTRHRTWAPKWTWLTKRAWERRTLQRPTLLRRTVHPLTSTLTSSTAPSPRPLPRRAPSRAPSRAPVPLLRQHQHPWPPPPPPPHPPRLQCSTTPRQPYATRSVSRLGVTTIPSARYNARKRGTVPAFILVPVQEQQQQQQQPAAAAARTTSRLPTTSARIRTAQHVASFGRNR